MIIHYHPKNRQWYHYSSLSNPLKFGKNEQPLYQVDGDLVNDTIPFLVTSLDERVGPLIGILADRKDNQTIAGNGSLFKEIQKKLLDHGGISIVFTPDGICESKMEGFVYLPNQDKWIPACCPLPHIVYNRIPYRKAEKSNSFEYVRALLKKHHIPFFNPSFINKYDMYELFTLHSTLISFLPDTIMVNEKKRLFDFLQNHQKIYLKPTQASKGKGISRMNLDSHQKITLTSISEQTVFPNFEAFWVNWEPTFQTKPFLAQEAITSDTLDGHRYDLRILAHFESQQYHVTGVGIRQSLEQDVTTHLPNGGRILPYTLIQNDRHDEFIKRMVQECGKILSEQLGFFGEFSIDAGITNTGGYVIYEVNSKPMSFDEEEIEANRIEKLCKLFFQKAAFVQASHG
ncbi:YheC/YheD family protein [Cytobacillus spongiae]|uniref:YheC/YheD family endospore coat-associated protein n=1 Tax=Cytobacillus spongiae TaxID=2901381 RepID=UPI001F3FF753|nr:YheC/YheD family protein [Cytobacillus spongiae]UII56853.1 YheC/YheD family protein [Cytobacillus spongiae]